MKKIILVISVIFTFSAELNNSMASSYDIDSRNCPILYKLEPWKYKTIKGGGYYWGRGQSWIRDSWEINIGVTIDLEQENNSYFISKNNNSSSVIIYVGPWKKVSLIKELSNNKEKIEAEIRMIASQRKSGLERHYEIKNEFNKNILEQSLVPIYSPQDITRYCDILWVQKYGYNAVADCSLNPFRWFTGKVLNCSGKIIDSETKEVIADLNTKDGRRE